MPRVDFLQLLVFVVINKGEKFIEFNCSPLECVGAASLRSLIFLFEVTSHRVNGFRSAGGRSFIFGG